MHSTGPSEVDITVRYAETDQMGVVHHRNYLTWFELGRDAFCPRSGYLYTEIEAMGFMLMVKSAELNYRRGARYGDTVRLSTELVRVRSRDLRFHYRCTRGDELLMTGATEHVWLEIASRRAIRAPRELYQAFRRLVSEADD